MLCGTNVHLDDILIRTVIVGGEKWNNTWAVHLILETAARDADSAKHAESASPHTASPV